MANLFTEPESDHLVAAALEALDLARSREERFDQLAALCGRLGQAATDLGQLVADQHQLIVFLWTMLAMRKP